MLNRRQIGQEEKWKWQMQANNTQMAVPNLNPHLTWAFNMISVCFSFDLLPHQKVCNSADQNFWFLLFLLFDWLNRQKVWSVFITAIITVTENKDDRSTHRNCIQQCNEVQWEQTIWQMTSTKYLKMCISVKCILFCLKNKYNKSVTKEL